MVKNTFKFIVVGILIIEARIVLWKYKPSIIAVTGSVGKTSTKDAIYAALKSSVYVRKSEKSFNSEVGVPLTILGCDTGWRNPVKWVRNILAGLALICFPNHYPKWLILEVGADAPGDIQRITKWIKPDIVVITSLPSVPVHVENFPSAQEVIQEKLALARALKPEGVLIINGDDKNVLQVRKQFSDTYVLTFGTEAHNDVAASHGAIAYDEESGKPTGMQFSVDEKGSSMPMRIYGRLGQQQIYPIVAAFAVARALMIAPTAVSKSIVSERGSLGRMRILDGHNNTTIIDDSYNSSPTALRAALSTLKKVKTTGRKIAILGDMLELGKHTDESHKNAGVYAGSIVDELVTVGVHTTLLAQAAQEAGLAKEHIHQFSVGQSQQAGKFVRSIIGEGDVILVKGSQSGIRLERAVRELLADPLEARHVLVRQDDEWFTKR